MSLGPFDLTGGPFLILYATLLAATVVAGFLIPRWLRPAGRSIPVSDPEKLAYLAGGTSRYTDTIVSRLLASGALRMISKDKFSVAGHGSTEAERAVLAMSAPTGWSPIERTLKRYAPAVERRLIADGLMIDSGTAWQLRFWQTAPYLLLIGFGLIKLDIGMLRDKPVGFLTMLLILTAVLALIRLVGLDRRTRGGIAALGEMRERSDRLRRAHSSDETDMAVALWGTALLAGSGIAGYHQLRSSSSGDGGSSSGSDGGSGCGGGGGCGGCGGG